MVSDKLSDETNPPDYLPDTDPAEGVSDWATELIERFRSDYPFGLDDYQMEGCGALAGGSGVLVAAPTGAGKTVVGEFAVWLAIQQNRKCFYTTPIKALSNQKYQDLVKRWGPERVGLLTGDLVVNSEAQIVVMTTEVLRNMIYAGSPTLSNLGYVVLDEVHYLADRFRGAVWEEVILGLADSVSLVALSATVSNVEEFGDWLGAVRGEMAVIVSERRPVPLFQHVMVKRRLHDLFAGEAPTSVELPSISSTRVNPELLAVAKAESRFVRDDSRQRRGRRHFNAKAPEVKRNEVSKWDLVLALNKADLLPAICFIFSRQGCDRAVQQLAECRLTTSEERTRLAAIADSHVGSLPVADLDALGYESFRRSLLNGIASHHAGLLPTFKAIVEESFSTGALKIVFATETLALGINMPARTVVLEKLTKYNGETHADITPGEYTQLTGRAGRRGIDVEGHAVVLWQPGIDPRAVAGLASRRTYPLRSSFAPTYNMAVNLVSTQGRDRARAILEQSFAQFQTDKGVVGTSRVLARLREEFARAAAAVSCDRGDFMAYARIRQQISALEAAGSKERRSNERSEIIASMRTTVVGDIIWVPRQGWMVVIGVGLPQSRTQQPWLRVLGLDHTVIKIEPEHLDVPLKPVSRLRVPKSFSLRERKDRRSLILGLANRIEQLDPDRPKKGSLAPDQDRQLQISELRAELAAHPCHGCPERESHAVGGAEALRIERELISTQQAADSRTNSLAVSFDRIVSVLTELGYLDNDRSTEAGLMLSRVYNELDLVACECIRKGVFEGLDAPQLAAVLSSLVYESRLVRSGMMARMPDPASERAQSMLRRVWRDVGQLERKFRIERTREPDIGFAEGAWRWAAGQELKKVLASTGLPAGDFVRWVRQVIDLAGQIAQAAGPGDLRRTCREVVDRMRRGIIAEDYLDD